MNKEKINTSNFNVNLFLTLQKGLIFFFLILAGNFIGELFQCKIIELFANNIYIKHIIAYISLYFFVILAESKFENTHPIKTLGITFLVYIWFILTSKSQPVNFLVVVGILVLIAFLEFHYKYVTNRIKNNEKISIVDKFIYDNHVITQKILIFLHIFFVIIGFIFYVGLKKIEYMGGWSWRKFFFKLSCNFDSDNTWNLTSFKDRYKVFKTAFY